MKTTIRNYTLMTIICAELGLVEYRDRLGTVMPGFYSLDGYNAPIDFTACAEDEGAILRTALKQLSALADECRNSAIERDLLV